jgi:hypothetical protein
VNIRKALIGGVVALGFASGYLIGQVDPHRHPNLAAAQNACAQASAALHRAQQANEYDMNGHATKAERLLSDAYREIQEAAGSANRR